MNVHQPILPSTTTIVSNVFVVGIQGMNFSINIFKFLMKWHNFYQCFNTNFAIIMEPASINFMEKIIKIINIWT